LVDVLLGEGKAIVAFSFILMTLWIGSSIFAMRYRQLVARGFSNVIKRRFNEAPTSSSSSTSYHNIQQGQGHNDDAQTQRENQASAAERRAEESASRGVPKRSYGTGV